MSWVGYFEYGGNEIVNSSRTEAYAKGAGWFKPVYEAVGLADLLGDDPYTNPEDDNADWTDPDDPNSLDFWGCYPLDVAGIDNSTAAASVTESTLDGGVVGRMRHSSKVIVFNLALVGASDAAVDYGLRWLRSVLSSDPCGPVGCGGETLCYLSAEPCGNGPSCGSAACVDPEERNLRRVGMTVGPTVTATRGMTDGGAIATVTFSLVAGTPFEWGPEIQLISKFGSGVNPYLPGHVTPPGGNWQDDGITRSDPDCATPIYQPLFDPLCAEIIAPPNAPDVPLSCFNFPASFRRLNFTIPEGLIPLWTSAVPTFEIKAKEEVRVLRLRFYADVRRTNTADTDPCSFCGDIVFSYIPAKSTLVFDAADRVVYVKSGSSQRRADSLVFSTDGKPFEWPELSCGLPYVVVVDLPHSQVVPIIDMSLTVKAL